MAVLEGMFVVSIYFLGMVFVFCLAAVLIYATATAIKRHSEKDEPTEIEESEDWFE